MLIYSLKITSCGKIGVRGVVTDHINLVDCGWLKIMKIKITISQIQVGRMNVMQQVNTQ